MFSPGCRAPANAASSMSSWLERVLAQETDQPFGHVPVFIGGNLMYGIPLCSLLPSTVVVLEWVKQVPKHPNLTGYLEH